MNRESLFNLIKLYVYNNSLTKMLRFEFDSNMYASHFLSRLINIDVYLILQFLS